MEAQNIFLTHDWECKYPANRGMSQLRASKMQAHSHILGGILLGFARSVDIRDAHVVPTNEHGM